MSRLTFATANISQRINMLEEALARVLNRDSSMSVEMGHYPGDRAVYVTDPDWHTGRIGHDLYQIARDLEALLP